MNITITIQSVPPKLLRAIGRLEVWTALLKAAVNESMGQATCMAQNNGMEREVFSMGTGQADLTEELAVIEETVGVIESTIVFVGTIQSRIDAAVAAAVANGVSTDHLQSLTDLAVVLGAKKTELAEAVAANS